MSYGLELTPEENVVRNYLKRAIDEDSRSLFRLRLIQRFAVETPELFVNAAISLLDLDDDSEALRFMIVKLLSQAGLMGVLSDPTRLDKNRAVRVFRRLMKHDRSLDVRLAQTLPDRYSVSQRLDLPACERALDVIDHVSEGRRIVPILGHLVDHPIPWISAKATLVVGKRVQSVNWVKRLLTLDRSPRDRANALETIWGLSTPQVRELFWDQSKDKSNRVTGNAVFGLHLAGEPQSAPVITRMAQRNEPEFRWTAAWLMGKIKAQEHADLLRQMIKDESPGVRSAVLKALIGIRKEERRRTAEEQRLRLALEPGSPQPLEPLEPAPQPEPESEPLVAEPAFNLLLDGRSFSFRSK